MSDCLSSAHLHVQVHVPKIWGTYSIVRGCGVFKDVFQVLGHSLLSFTTLTFYTCLRIHTVDAPLTHTSNGCQRATTCTCRAWSNQSIRWSQLKLLTVTFACQRGSQLAIKLITMPPCTCTSSFVVALVWWPAICPDVLHVMFCDNFKGINKEDAPMILMCQQPTKYPLVLCVLATCRLYPHRTFQWHQITLHVLPW